MTAEEIAWGAGFWEGEGSVQAWKHRAKPTGKEYVYLVVTASQKEPETLERMHTIFGGQAPRRSSNVQRIWRWQITGAQAEKFIDTIWPWLSERRKTQIQTVRARVAEAPAKRGYTRRVASSPH